MSGLISLGILAGLAFWGYGCHRAIEVRATETSGGTRPHAAEPMVGESNPSVSLEFDRQGPQVTPLLD
jgi:hypothetical protein